MKSSTFKGKYTNHSLRASAATRLFQKGFDEQLVMSVIGHCSNAVSEYKHVSSTQQKQVSEAIHGNHSNISANISTEPTAPINKEMPILLAELADALGNCGNMSPYLFYHRLITPMNLRSIIF